MISYETSVKIINNLVKEIKQSEVCKISNSLGRILSEDIIARFDCPRTDKSSMDGIVILEKDFNINKIFKLKGEIKTGHKRNFELSSKEATLIYTGASIPGKKKKIVILKENCTLNKDNTVEVRENLTPESYIRKKGKDFKNGQLCVKRNSIINIRTIGLLKTLEKDILKVKRKPKVGIIVTGDEIVKKKNFDNTEYIPSSNSDFLRNFLNFYGAELVFLKTVGDSEKAISKIYKTSKNVDLLITTGGLSEGKYDLVKKTLFKLGLKLKFEKVAIRPGKPISFGLFKANNYFLGLPGNPVSCFVGSLFFMSLILKKLKGTKELLFQESLLKSNCYIPKNNELTKFFRIKIISKNNKKYFNLITNQDSSMQYLLTQSDGIIIRKPFEKSIKSGQYCNIILFKDFSTYLI